MTPEQFAYWLQGYAELNEQPPTAEQWQSIREHLATVFHKVTPPISPSNPAIPLGPLTPPYTPSLKPLITTCSPQTLCASADGDTWLVC